MRRWKSATAVSPWNAAVGFTLDQMPEHTSKLSPHALAAVLDDAVAEAAKADLSTSMSEMAARIWEAIDVGERYPVKLKAKALGR